MAHRVYDHSYRDIFSEPEVVRDLIKAFVRADWVGLLDFSTLEPVKDKYVSNTAYVREQDSIWRIKFDQQEWLYLYIFLEFQSRNDRFMAVRFFTYMGMLFEHLIKSKQLTSNFLPPILPFVIYTGSRPWSAPLHSSDLFMQGLPKLLKRHQPHFEYHLLDIGRCILDGSMIESNNLVAPLIQFEQSVQRREQALVIIQEIDKKFSSKAFDSYRRAMYSYVYRMTRLGKLEPIDFTDLESASMLAQERIKIYDKTLIKQGHNEGLQKGLQKGLERGLQKGLQKGRLLATRELAQNMLASGIDIEQVMKITGLSMDVLQRD